jgi:hypothetical protein
MNQKKGCPEFFPSFAEPQDSRVESPKTLSFRVSVETVETLSSHDDSLLGTFYLSFLCCSSGAGPTHGSWDETSQ